MTNKKLLNLFQKAAEKGCLDEVFFLMFTPSEQEIFENRVLIIQKLLEEKEPQRTIAANLKASISQVTAGSRALRLLSPSLKKFLKEFFGIK